MIFTVGMRFVFALAALCHVGVDAKQKVAIYWGQDDGILKEDSLKSVVDSGAVDRIYLSFALPCAGSKIFEVKGVSYVDFNMANHTNGGSCTVLTEYPGIQAQECSSLVADCTKCVDCEMPLAEQIKYAQKKDIEILLSVGGGAESEGELPDAAQLSKVLSQMFLEPDASYTGPRPFGDVVLDGIDLDLEQMWHKMPHTWMSTFLKAFPRKPLLTIAPQCFDFNTQYGASISGVIAASARNNSLLHPEQVCRFDSLNVQFYNNEGALDDGSDFSKTGSDADLAKALNDSPVDCWDDYAYSWFKDGKPHCMQSKFLTTAAIWAGVAKQCTEWRASSGGGTTYFVFGTAVDQLSPDGSSGGLPWPQYVKRSSLASPKKQITKLLKSLSALGGSSFGGVMLWDRGNDLTVGAQMPKNTTPSRIFQDVLAGMQQLSNGFTV